MRRIEELTEDLVQKALESREKTAELMTKLADISRPDDGAAKILLLFSRLASAPWLEGTLRVDLRADGETTVVDVLLNSGGMRERLFRRATLRAPLAELADVITHLPRRIAPLVVYRSEEGRIVLEPPAVESQPPVVVPTVTIEESSVRGTSRPPEGRESRERRERRVAMPEKPARVLSTVSFEAEAVARAAERVRRANEVAPSPEDPEKSQPLPLNRRRR